MQEFLKIPEWHNFLDMPVYYFMALGNLGKKDDGETLRRTVTY